MKLVAWLAALVASAVGCGMVAAAQSAGPVPASSPLANLTFEVATIKPNNSGSENEGYSYRDDRFVANNVTVKFLLRMVAYHLPASRIVGGPAWLDSAHFDVRAKLDSSTAARIQSVDEEAGKDAYEALVQNLLAARFHFAAHWEQRDLSAYALVANKGGPKLQPAAHPERGPIGTWGREKIELSDLTLSEFADLLTC